MIPGISVPGNCRFLYILPFLARFSERKCDARSLRFVPLNTKESGQKAAVSGQKKVVLRKGLNRRNG